MTGLRVITTTVYPSTNAEGVDYILTDCAAVVVFAEDATQLAKLRSGNGFVGDVHHVVLFDGESDGDAVLSLDGLATLGRHHLGKHPDAVDQVLAAITPENLATTCSSSGCRSRTCSASCCSPLSTRSASSPPSMVVSTASSTT